MCYFPIVVVLQPRKSSYLHRILAPVLLTLTLAMLNCNATLYTLFPKMKLQC